MKALTLRFCHPVNGLARFIQASNGHVSKKIKVTSDINNEVKISLKDLAVGVYQLVFEWEYESNFFSITRNIAIQASSNSMVNRFEDN